MYVDKLPELAVAPPPPSRTPMLFSARFIKNFATLTEPLRDLTKQTSEWRWVEKEASAFQRVKDSLEESATTAYFDMHKDIDIVVDASPVGQAALLVQEGRVVIR